MSIQNNARPGAAPSIGANTLAAILSGGTQQEAAPERAKSKMWLNIGVAVPGAGEDGADLFVSLPVGVPLDTMKALKARGGNTKWNQLVGAKNHLLEQLQTAGASLEAGAHLDLPQLTVRLQYVTEVSEGDQDGGSNPLIAGLTAAISGK